MAPRTAVRPPARIAVIGTASARNHDKLWRRAGRAAARHRPRGDRRRPRHRRLRHVPELIGITGDPAKVLSLADFSAPLYGAKVSSTSVDPAGAFAEAARPFGEGAFHSPVPHQFSLADAAAAHAASQTCHVVGRIVVAVSPTASRVGACAHPAQRPGFAS